MKKVDELVERAIKLCSGMYGATFYDNTYPNNVGCWHGDSWSFDCLGFVHTLVNGWNNDRTKLGGGAVMDNFVLLTGEYETLCTCYDVSADMANIQNGELMYMDGHVGLYVGEIVVDRVGSKDYYNVAECSPAFSGGCQLTYVDSIGTRYNKKGGTVRGKWEKHGKLLRVDYTQTDEAPRKMTADEYAVFINTLALGIISGTYGCNPERKETMTKQFGAKAYQNAQKIVNMLYELEQD